MRGILLLVVAMAAVAYAGHRLIRWCGPHFLRRVPDVAPAQQAALVKYAERKMWFAYLIGAMAALIVITVGSQALSGA